MGEQGWEVEGGILTCSTKLLSRNLQETPEEVMDAVAGEWIPRPENLSAQGKKFHLAMTIGGRFGAIKLFQRLAREQDCVCVCVCVRGGS